MAAVAAEQLRRQQQQDLKGGRREMDDAWNLLQKEREIHVIPPHTMLFQPNMGTKKCQMNYKTRTEVWTLNKVTTSCHCQSTNQPTKQTNKLTKPISVPCSAAAALLKELAAAAAVEVEED